MWDFPYSTYLKKKQFFLFSINFFAIFAFFEICLTEQGEIYTWGSYKRGVLGYKAEVDEKEPRKVPSFSDKRVVKIECGADFNVALTEVFIFIHFFFLL